MLTEQDNKDSTKSATVKNGAVVNDTDGNSLEPKPQTTPDIASLTKKIEQFKQEANLGSDGQDKNEETKPSHMSIELLGGVIAGLVLGYFLDDLFSTKPWFFIICFILGFLGGVRNILRKIK